MRRHDDARRPRPLRAADHGAEVARVAHLVEAREERTLRRRELVGVRVLERLAPGEHALMVARARALADVLVELDLHPWLLGLAQPGLGLHRTLGRPELEHLTRAAERLVHRSPPVDLLAGHRGTIRDPPGSSTTSKPSSRIRPRSSSARPQSFAARASSRSRRRPSTSTSDPGSGGSRRPNSSSPWSSRYQ